MTPWTNRFSSVYRCGTLRVMLEAARDDRREATLAVVIEVLRLVAGVPSRVGEVWMRVDSYPETLIIVGDAVLTPQAGRDGLTPYAGDQDSGWLLAGRMIRGACRSGWCHEVILLQDTNQRRHLMNENWFHNSGLYRRIA